MLNLQTELQKIELEFKSAFPNTTFASVLDRQQASKARDFVADKFESFTPKDADDTFYYNLIQEMANHTPILYSISKAECFVTDVSYYIKSQNEGQKWDAGIIGINEPVIGHVMLYQGSLMYVDGVNAKASDTSTAAEWQAYLARSFADCEKYYFKSSSFDTEIEQFKAEIPGKILASLDHLVHTEL